MNTQPKTTGTHFTAPPWVVETDELQYGRYLLLNFPADETYRRHGLNGIDREHEANRALIEAAPDLYAALEALMAAWAAWTTSDTPRTRLRRAAMWEQANQALAKARGDSNA
jgi:hypothetical protein